MTGQCLHLWHGFLVIVRLFSSLFLLFLLKGEAPSVALDPTLEPEALGWPPPLNRARPLPAFQV